MTELAVRWACPLQVHGDRVSEVFDTLGAVKYTSVASVAMTRMLA